MELYAKHFLQCSVINHKGSTSKSNNAENIIGDEFKVPILDTPAQVLSHSIGLDPVVRKYYFFFILI